MKQKSTKSVDIWNFLINRLFSAFAHHLYIESLFLECYSSEMIWNDASFKVNQIDVIICNIHLCVYYCTVRYIYFLAFWDPQKSVVAIEMSHFKWPPMTTFVNLFIWSLMISVNLKFCKKKSSWLISYINKLNLLNF